MPHVIVEYSANLEASIDFTTIVAAVHACVLASKISRPAAVRTRAERREIFRVADGDERKAFVHVMVRLAAGRAVDERKSLAAALLGTIKEMLIPIYTEHPTAVTVEVEEIQNIAARHSTIVD